MAAERAHRLVLLRRDIEARAARNKRLAEGWDVAPTGTPGASGTSSAGSPPAATPPRTGSLSFRADASGEALSELDEERKLTAALQRAVMSC